MSTSPPITKMSTASLSPNLKLSYPWGIVCHMTLDELKTAVMALDSENKKRFILEALPELMKDAMQDSMFLMELFPVFVDILKQRGIEMEQLLQLATLLEPAAKAGEA